MKIKLAAATALLLASTAAGSAADLAVKARPYIAPAPIYTWTGFYLGVHVGAGWGTTETTLTGLNATDGEDSLVALFGLPFAQNSSSGFLGGVQAGYNWQSGIAVFGVQADFAGAGIKGTTPCLVILSCTTKSDWLATVSGRVGAVVAERGLIYVKGGAAWLNNRQSVNLPNFGAQTDGTIAGQELISKESTNFGWLLGMGVEYAFTPNWTAFVEYNYMQFDRKNQAFLVNPALTGDITATINADVVNKLSIAKFGVNYKFDYGAPVVAKY